MMHITRDVAFGFLAFLTSEYAVKKYKQPTQENLKKLKVIDLLNYIQTLDQDFTWIVEGAE